MRTLFGKRGPLLLFALAAPAFLGAEPIGYQLLFPASGTFTNSSTGQQTSFNTNVVIWIGNDTKLVTYETDGDGDVIGWQTVAPLATISIPGVVEAAGAPVQILAPAGAGLEFYQSPETYLSTTLVVNTPFESYNLTSNTAAPISLTINYFNQGVWETTKGAIAFTPATVTGYFTGTLIPTATQAP